MKRILGFAILLVSLFALPAFAHPDVPPPNGCHVCNENCRGIPKGDWHCHPSRLRGGPTSGSGPLSYDATDA